MPENPFVTEPPYLSPGGDTQAVLIDPGNSASTKRRRVDGRP